MKVMVLVKATERSESGEFGPAEEFVAMDLFNEKLVEAGVVLAADGLQPTSKGKRVAFDADGSTTVIDGPFAETKELVAGFSIWGGRLNGRGRRVDQALAVARQRGRSPKGPRR